MSSVPPQQYPVGGSHNINNGMRAADGSGDMLGLQDKAPSRGMRYLVNTTKKKSCCHKKHIIVTYSYAYTLKQGRAEKRRHHTHPWIYGSPVGAWLGPFNVLQYVTAGGCGDQSPGNRRRSSEHDLCMPGTYDKKIFIDDEKAMLIPPQVSRDIRDR